MILRIEFFNFSSELDRAKRFSFLTWELVTSGMPLTVYRMIEICSTKDEKDYNVCAGLFGSLVKFWALAGIAMTGFCVSKHKRPVF